MKIDYNKLADMLYPNVDKDINYYFNKYPSRNIYKDAVVTRFAPSPTGYLHIGGLYQCVFHQMLSKTPSSVFYLRLEDTDQKREIAEAGDILYETMLEYGLEPSEGYRGKLEERGVYGPYVQSKRLDIYRTFAKYLVSRGRAFPCFCNKLEDKEEIAAKREQEIQENNTTIDHDPCRSMSLEEIEENLSLGKPFALRLLSLGNPEKSFEFNDVVKGKRQIRENGKDIILIKSNGIPVYAFAHAVDDTLMGTTVVVRGEDWFQSVASHVELFNAFGFEPIPYIHTPNIMKIEEGRKRKLSKRKDQEADCRFYLEDGYPIVAVKEYLLNIINSDFESWRKENPNLDYTEFPFSVSKVTTSNALFDFAKLNDISKEYIAKLSAEEVYKFVLDWARKYDEEFAQMLINNKEFAINVFNIDRGGEKPRKDIYKWSMVRDYYKYMFEDFSNIELDFRPITSLENELLYKCLHTYVVLFEDGIDKTFWFERMKKLANNFGYCSDNKEYKKNPLQYKGNLASFCNFIRYAFTGRTNTPDLFSICEVLGRDELFNRISIIKHLLNL